MVGAKVGPPFVHCVHAAHSLKPHFLSLHRLVLLKHHASQESGIVGSIVGSPVGAPGITDVDVSTMHFRHWLQLTQPHASSQEPFPGHHRLHCPVVGSSVGAFVTSLVGASVGCREGLFVGNIVGNIVGHIVGLFVGNNVGNIEGLAVGNVVGKTVGYCVGHLVGVCGGKVGFKVGLDVQRLVH